MTEVRSRACARAKLRAKHDERLEQDQEWGKEGRSKREWQCKR